MVKWMLAIGQNFCEEILSFTFSTVSERFIMQPHSKARSSSVTYFCALRRFGRWSWRLMVRTEMDGPRHLFRYAAMGPAPRGVKGPQVLLDPWDPLGPL